MTRTDRFGVEVRERVMWDIREGVVGYVEQKFEIVIRFV